MYVTVYRKTLLRFPSAHRPHTPIEIGSDLLPRLETVPRWLSHLSLLHGAAKVGQSGPQMDWPFMTVAGPCRRA
jgi:hypothetical protein